MNRADKMLTTLRAYPKGVWINRAAFYSMSGFYLTNNAASELRARGYNVEHRKQGRGDFYRLADAS